MTTLKAFSPWILEAWATWEVMRRLGFSADEIFWEFRQTLNLIPGPGIGLNVVLRTQGLDFSVTCSHRLTEAEAAALNERSGEFQQALRDGRFPESELEHALHASYIWRNKAQFLVALKGKGFTLPCSDVEAQSN